MRVRAFLIPLLVVAGGACSGDDGIRVDDAWARPSPQMTDAAAVYFEITAPRADRLVGVSVPESIAARAEIHESTMSGDGVMTMAEVGEIELPPHTTVTLAPGGLHIMLLGLMAPLQAGGTFDLTLDFERAAPLRVAVAIREGT